MIDVTPPPVSPEAPPQQEEMNDTCYACGEILHEGQPVTSNITTGDFGNAKITIELVCCSDECAQLLDTFGDIILNHLGRVLTYGLHTKGDPQQISLRLMVNQIVRMMSMGKEISQ